ncbi:hypothetical protein HYH02_005827 [Chlamydomonas schloesseri]|uniref:Uncharacterized protein n=1 Tax=Chlamydomonas schloesseri TaxID=2026947 RepID=A0A836B6Q9_9CHLO|nr:hypothetical protein HYH02_005827 [Chlamydomonas schloesseri]|eukprot:KAG2449078.1 hypothetical protein HYH02_005827 [Chlamydomonas schloesseri]
MATGGAEATTGRGAATGADPAGRLATARNRDILPPTAWVDEPAQQEQPEDAAAAKGLQRPRMRSAARPLSFGRWFARQARAADIAWLLTEVVLISWLHAVRLGEALYCRAGGSGDAQSGLAAGCSSGSSGSSTFPCGGGLVAKLLWSLTSGAVIDPRLRLRMWDYSNLLYMWTQLAIVAIALLAPAVYERCRHVLVGGASAVALLGVHYALLSAPAGPFPANASTLLSAGRRRIGAAYMGWKSATLFRTPASVQLVTGPLLWLLAVTALPLVDRRIPPPGGGGGGTSALRIAVHALVLFVVMAVVPYLLCRFWETRALRAAYGRYLRQQQQQQGSGPDSSSTGASEGAIRASESGGVCARERSGPQGESGRGAPAGSSRGMCSPGEVGGPGSAGGTAMSSSGGASSDSSNISIGSSSSNAGTGCGSSSSWRHSRRSAASSRPSSPSMVGTHGGHWPLLAQSALMPPADAVAVAAEQARAAAGPTPGVQRSAIYRSPAMTSSGLSGRSRIALVSVKVPIRHRGNDPGAGLSSLARDAAEGSAGRARQLLDLEAASAAVLRSAAAALDAHNQRACEQRRWSADAAAGPPPPLRCLSTVCVEGCVQLLMVVHLMAAGEEAAEAPEATETRVYHARLPPAHPRAGVAGAAGISAAAVAAADGGGILEPDSAAAATAAVQQLLAQVGVDEVSDTGGAASNLLAGSGHIAALCWPPALPLLPGPACAHGVADQEETEEELEDTEAVVVLLQLPAGAPARGLRSVRCVLAGPPAPEEEEAGGAEKRRGGAAADVHMDAELPLHLLHQPPPAPPGEGADSDAVTAFARLPMPRSARQGPSGVRMLHVLPPLGLDPVGGPGSKPVSGGDGSESTAPLAAVPLLVVGREAAAELQQLHGQVLGSEAVAQLQQLGAEACSSSSSSSSSSRAAAEALAEAAAALQHSGLTSLMLDLGALLQLPVGGEDGATADPAAAFGELLRFLAAQRMAGCLREGLAVLQQAGEGFLRLPGGDVVSGVITTSAGATADAVTSGVCMAAGGGLSDASAEWSPAAAHKGASGGGGGPAASTFPEHLEPMAVPLATPPSSYRYLWRRLLWWLRVLACGFPRSPAPAASSSDQQAGSSSHLQGAEQQPSIRRSSSSSSPEAAYQAYKAASCRPLDCMSLVVYAAFRIITLIRTFASAGLLMQPPAPAAARAAVGGGILSWALSQARMAVCLEPAHQPLPRPERNAGCPHPPYLEGCLRPYLDGRLTDTQLQVLAQLVFLGTCVIAIVLMACTQLHARRRNAFLLLRAALDAAAFLLVVLPLPRWPGPLLAVPQCWLDNNRRTGMHWMVFGLYEPLTLQLSPPLQALQALIFVLPLTLLGYHSSSCRWRPALRFGLGHAVLALAVSAATDARSRMLYLRRRAHGGAGGRA